MEIVSMPAETRGDHEVELVTITPEHRQLFEKLGCHWPAPEDEAQWLADVSHLATIASDVSRHKNREHSTEVQTARELFYDLLPGLNQTNLRYTSTALHSSSLFAVSTTLKALEFLDGMGVDVTVFGRHSPSILKFSVETLSKRVDNLHSLGFSAYKMVNMEPTILGFRAESIHERLQPMFAAIRVLGWPREVVIDTVQKAPSLLRQKSDRMRTLLQIAFRTILPIEPEDVSVGFIRSLATPRLEQTVGAYLEFGPSIRSFLGLAYNARQYDDWSKEALQGLILQHPDDWVVKSYLRGYPIDEPEAVAFALERHIHARDRRQSGLHLGVTVRALSSIEATSFYSFKTNVTSIPRLDDDQLTELDKAIARGMEAASRVDTHILEDYEEESADASQRARTTLIERHLYLATDAAMRWAAPKQREDIAGAACLALVKAGRSYVPGTETFETYAREIVNNAVGHPIHPPYILHTSLN